MSALNRTSPDKFREDMQRRFGTKCLSPLCRWNTEPYMECRFCHCWFTYLGHIRHENRCGFVTKAKRKPKQK